MISFELSDLINFLFGILTGVLLFTATFVYLIVRGNSINLKKIKLPSYRVKEEEIRKVIIKHQNKLTRSLKLNRNNVAKLTFDISYELIDQIARFYFPNSKYPMLELSVHEIITLNHYVSDRIDSMLDKPVIKNTKNLRITQIMKLYDKKKLIEQSRAMKLNKKYKVDKVFKYSMMTLNAFNPVYWFRKLVINTSVDVITRRICVLIIGVVGEETTKIYSKKVFNKEDDLKLVDEQLQAFFDGVDDDEETIAG
jgi:hypothetical protein